MVTLRYKRFGESQSLRFLCKHHCSSPLFQFGIELTLWWAVRLIPALNHEHNWHPAPKHAEAGAHIIAGTYPQRALFILRKGQFEPSQRALGPPARKAGLKRFKTGLARVDSQLPGFKMGFRVNSMPAEKLSNLLRQHGLGCLLYLAHPENLYSILEKGILPYNEVQRTGVPHEDIANAEVQQRRNRAVFDKHLHDFVPLYMARRNPMLWVRRCLPRAYIRLKLEVADKSGTVFSDCNASSYWAKFYRDPEDISQIPWEVILAPTWTGLPDGKRKRCAEILVPGGVEPSFILDIRSKYTVNVPSGYEGLLIEDHEYLSA